METLAVEILTFFPELNKVAGQMLAFVDGVDLKK